MRFTFDDDARAFQAGLRDVLGKMCTPAHVRAAAGAAEEEAASASCERWRALADLGALGCLVPEEHGGLALDERTAVLLLEEAGRAALPEPLLETAAVGAALLRDVGGEAAAHWLPRIAAGDAVVAVSLPGDAYVAGAAAADVLLLTDGDELHAVLPGDVELTAQPALDPTVRLATVGWSPAPATRVSTDAGRALAAAGDRRRVGTAALLLGIARRVIAMATTYAGQREQFGAPIGSFQAVKHHLATAHVRTEMAAPLVYRAAWSVATGHEDRARNAAMARLAAGEAADLACRTALQVHGAIGYTVEHDLHLWLVRAWTLGAHHADEVEAVLERSSSVPRVHR